MAMPADATPLEDGIPAIPAPRFTTPVGKLEDDLVWQAIGFIDCSKLLPTIQAWKEADGSGAGGRPETFPVRALLVAMALCVMTNQPVLATRFTSVLFRQISPTMRHALGVPKPPEAKDDQGWDNCYRNVRTRFHALIGLMDPSWLPKNRRMDAVKFEALMELRRLARSDEEWNERFDRLSWFINEILEMSLRTLPRSVRRAWKGSVAVDATVVPVFARPARTEKRLKKKVAPRIIRYSTDPDAGLYHRDKRKAENGDVSAALTILGYEASLAVSGSDDPSAPSAMPSLTMAMAPLHRPGAEPGKNAIRALTSMRDRGHPAHFLAGDLAYTQSKAEDYQLPAMALGFEPVHDYKIDQLGLQGSYEGMIMVGGCWYCPEMPLSLVNATLELRKGLIDEVTHAARIEERRAYQMRRKTMPDADGHVRVYCPAASPNPVARCELKPASEGPSDKVKVRIPVTDVLATHRPKICSQQSITRPPEAGAKFAQILPHKTPEWQAVYGTLRNGVEGMNGFVKDGAREALDDPERRRIRGVAPQSLFVAFLLFSANLRRIDSFLAGQEAEARKIRKLPSRRKTKSLNTWAPAKASPPIVALTGTMSITLGFQGNLAVTDPDPPLIA
jgi:hypothetical protein